MFKMKPAAILCLGALLLLSACGGGSGWLHSGEEYPRWGGGECFDSQGFPVPCNQHGHNYKMTIAAEGLGWSASANGPLVSDVNGQFFSFDAAEPRWLRVGDVIAPDLRAEEDGRVFHLDREVGFVALVRSAAGENVAALVAMDGTYLDLAVEDGGLVLRRTANPAEIAAPAASTGVTASPDDPVPPAGASGSVPLVLDGNGIVGVRVESL